MRGYIVLPHVVPIVAVLAATAAFALIATGGRPDMLDVGCLIGAMFGGQLAVGAVNELVDAELDAVSRPAKPIPAGLVSRRGAMTVTVVGLVLMCAFSLRFSLAAFALCVFGNGTGIAYSLWFKRTVWSWLPYVVAIPLIPVWVWTALDAFPARMLVMYPLAIPAVIALHIAQSIPDVRGDRRAGVKTLAVWLGEDRACAVGWGLMGVTILTGSVTAPAIVEAPGWPQGASLVAAVLVGCNVALWRQPGERGATSMFPLTTAAVILLGIGWTLGAFG